MIQRDVAKLPVASRIAPSTNGLTAPMVSESQHHSDERPDSSWLVLEVERQR